MAKKVSVQKTRPKKETSKKSLKKCSKESVSSSRVKKGSKPKVFIFYIKMTKALIDYVLEDQR